MTITNPDSSSKADLLHIINTGNGFKLVPGPDVKVVGVPMYLTSGRKLLTIGTKFRWLILMVYLQLRVD